MSEVARAAPDGYTFGFANTGNIVINPFLFQKLNYDPLTDLIPVGPVGTVQLFLVSNTARIPATSLQEFVAYAKANPDKVSYAGAGAGTTPDLAWHDFAQRAGLKTVVVPHRGTGPATQAVLGGDVQVTFVSMGPHMEFVKKGVLRVLGSAALKRPPHMATCRPSPSRASRTSWPRPGSDCSRRAERRRRSSTRSTAIPAASTTIPRWRSAWHRPMSARSR